MYVLHTYVWLFAEIFSWWQIKILVQYIYFTLKPGTISQPINWISILFLAAIKCFYYYLLNIEHNNNCKRSGNNKLNSPMMIRFYQTDLTPFPDDPPFIFFAFYTATPFSFSHPFGMASLLFIITISYFIIIILITKHLN